MKTINLLVIIILSLNMNLLYSQNSSLQRYRVHARMLGANEYEKEKVVESPYVKLDVNETIEALGDSIRTYDLDGYKYIDYITFKNGETGNFFDGNETVIVGYYPELRIITLGDCNTDYLIDMNTGKRLDMGDPQYDRISPSERYRITGIQVDGMEYYFEEKKDDKYQKLGSLQFNGYQVKGLYWADDSEIHFLARNYDEEAWIAYYGTIKLMKDEY